MINASFPDGPQELLSLQLWKATTLIWADSSTSAIFLVHGESEDAEKLIARLKRASACKRAVANDIKLAISRKRSQKEFTELGPCAKLQALREANLPQFKLNRFFRTAAQDLALAGIRKCFGSFASAIRCYYKFCELRNCPPVPGNGAYYPRVGRYIQSWGYIQKLCRIHPESMLLFRNPTNMGHTSCGESSRISSPPGPR